MSDATLTLVLDGKDIPLADFTNAASHFCSIVYGLTRHLQAGDVTWYLDELAYGSATMATRGEVASEKVEALNRAYIDVGLALSENEEDRIPSTYRRDAKAIFALLNGQVEEVRFETPDDEVVVRRPDLADELRIQVERHPKAAFGGVMGRIETIARRRGLRFTLYDTVHDKPVSCYLADGYEDIMRNAWGRLAIVEGIVSRDAVTGRPLTVRQVRSVTLIEEGDPLGYKRARGVLAPLGESPQEAIRRMRDA
jgi:hypothetical protein